MLEHVELKTNQSIPLRFFEEWKHRIKQKSFDISYRNQVVDELYNTYLQENPFSVLSKLEFKNKIQNETRQLFPIKEIEMDFLFHKISFEYFIYLVEFSEKYMYASNEEIKNYLEHHKKEIVSHNDIFEYLLLTVYPQLSKDIIYEFYIRYTKEIGYQSLFKDADTLYRAFKNKDSEEYKRFKKKLEKLYFSNAEKNLNNETDIEYQTTLNDVEANRIVLNKIFYQEKNKQKEKEELYKQYITDCKSNHLKVVFNKQDFEDLYIAHCTPFYNDIIHVYIDKLTKIDYRKHNKEMMMKQCYQMYLHDCQSNRLSAKSFNEFKNIAIVAIRERGE